MAYPRVTRTKSARSLAVTGPFSAQPSAATASASEDEAGSERCCGSYSPSTDVSGFETSSDCFAPTVTTRRGFPFSSSYASASRGLASSSSSQLPAPSAAFFPSSIPVSDLSPTVFGELWRLEPLAPAKKAMWMREMDWLLSVACDSIVEIIPCLQDLPDGGGGGRAGGGGGACPSSSSSSCGRPSSVRQEDKWWLPCPRVPPKGLSEEARRKLQQSRDCANQILKAAMAINSDVLAEMEIPENVGRSLSRFGPHRARYTTVSPDMWDSFELVTMAWELTEVPGNPTPLQHSTVDVVAANIVPKVTNTLIRQLSQVCPLENLRHVKRVRRRVVCGGSSELSIILCLSTGPENCSEGFPEEVQKIVDNYHLSPFIAKVASCSATSKEEWEEQCKLWPTSYHPPHDIDGVSGFKEEELPSIFHCMRIAMQLSQVGNAAIIVDPSSMQIISKATDQTHQRDTFLERNKCAMVEADNARSFPEAIEDKANSLLPSSSRFCNGLDREVSCINPFGWMKQRCTEQKTLPSEGGFLWHPLWHAAVVAIENAAKRDRMTFPASTSSTTQPKLNGDVDNCADDEPAKRLKIVTNDGEQSAHPACSSDLSERNRPYLCTGFDIYLVWEPCTMCAMALVHQRFKRVFYAFPNPVTGALGSVYRLHGKKSLNHHYSVFRIKVPEAYLNGSTDCSEKGCSNSLSS